MQEVSKQKQITIGIICIGLAILVLNIALYPFLLPNTITSQNSIWIEQAGYLFYFVLLGSISLTAFGVSKMFQVWAYNNKVNLAPKLSSSSPSPLQSTPLSESLLQSTNKLVMLTKIIIEPLSNKRYFKFFWPASTAYGIFYAIVSSMLIYHPHLSHMYGVTIPSITIMSYGPTGYVPTIAAAITENIGLLIIPVNLVIMISVSTLVGINTVLSIYAFKDRPKNKSTNKYSTAMCSLGATTGLFAACPTCASLYIFGILAGPFAHTLAAFAVSLYYSLFLFVSVPILLIAPLLTASSIHKMRMVDSNVFGQCSLKKQK
jgi:hypothetical protein